VPIYQREYEKRLRIGVVGVGSHSYRNIFPALHYLPIELIAVCDLDEALATATAKEFGVPQVYTSTAEMYANAKLDAVLICVSPGMHPRLAIEAMNAGVHAWTEKPAAARASQVREMIEARDRNKRVAAVGYKKANMPATRKAKELLDSPEFGKLRSIYGIYPMSIPKDGAATLESREVSKWLADGCHPLSCMVALGGYVREVTVLQGDAEDADGVLFLKFQNGATGTFHLTSRSPAGHSIERYDVFGEAGRVISIENVSKVSYHRGIPFSYTGQTDFTAPGTDSGSVVWQASNMLGTPENKSDFIQGMYNEIGDFCGAILEDRPIAVTDLEFALNIMNVYEAALMSNGKPVTLPE
jgi:predicted dehydrogenase